MTSMRRYGGQPAYTPAQKAAAVLAAMGRERAARMLKHFRKEELRILIEAGRTLQTIPQPDLAGLVGEFETAFEEGAGLLDSAERIRQLVDEELSEEELDAIFARRVTGAAPDTAVSGVWAQLEAADPERLATLFAAENPLVPAVICSRLAPGKVADILRRLDRPRRSAIIGRLLAIGDVSPAAMRLIESALSRSFDGAAATGADRAGTERVADVISEFATADADDVLVDLVGVIEEKRLAEIRKMLFRFEDMARMTAQERTLLFDGLSTDIVTEAARGQPAQLRELILSALSQRTRRMVESELAGNAPAGRASEAARRTVVARAKRLVSEGLIAIDDQRDAA